MSNANEQPVLSVQTTQLIAQIISILGMLATTFGWLTPQQVSSLATNILAAIGPLATIGGFVWSVVSSRKQAIVSAVATMPEVRLVVTEPTAAGHELANGNTPSNVIVAPPGSVPPKL